jgi:hypothetical protein
LVEVDLPPFVDDFNPKMDLVLDIEAFVFALMHSPRLSSDNPLNMVYEPLQYCFVLDDFASGFDFCFEISMQFVVMFLHQYHACFLQHDY